MPNHFMPYPTTVLGGHHMYTYPPAQPPYDGNPNVNIPPVRVVGGSPAALLTLFNWMTRCCEQNALIALEQVDLPTRLRNAEAIQILGVTHLANTEYANLMRQFVDEIPSYEDLCEILAMQNLVPDIVNAIISTITRHYVEGTLSQDQFQGLFHLSEAFPAFDHAVRCKLAQVRLRGAYPHVIAAEQTWANRSLYGHNQAYGQGWCGTGTWNGWHTYPGPASNNASHSPHHRHHNYTMHANPHTHNNPVHAHAYYNHPQLAHTVPQQYIPHPETWNARNPGYLSQCRFRGELELPCSSNCPHHRVRPQVHHALHQRPARSYSGRHQRRTARTREDPHDEHAYPGEDHKFEYHMNGTLIKHIFTNRDGQRRVVNRPTYGGRMESMPGDYRWYDGEFQSAAATAFSEAPARPTSSVEVSPSSILVG